MLRIRLSNEDRRDIKLAAAIDNRTISDCVRSAAIVWAHGIIQTNEVSNDNYIQNETP